MLDFGRSRAGTGKSLTLRRALQQLRTQYADEEQYRKAVVIAAPTGIAASHIGGTTLNTCAGLATPQTHADFDSVGRRRQQQPVAADASAGGAASWWEVEVPFALPLLSKPLHATIVLIIYKKQKQKQ